MTRPVEKGILLFCLHNKKYASTFEKCLLKRNKYFPLYTTNSQLIKNDVILLVLVTQSTSTAIQLSARHEMGVPMRLINLNHPLD